MSLSSTCQHHLRSVAEHTIDAHVGLVHSLVPLDLEAGAPPFFHFAAQLCNLQACGWQTNAARMEGASAVRDLAAMAALTEALRFYAAGFYARNELALLRYDDAPETCIDPSCFALFSDQQYQRPELRFAPFDAATAVRWVPGQDLGSGVPCHLPAAFVMVPYEVREDDEEACIAPASSGGLACGCSWEQTIITAICGAIRDDVAAIVWQRRLPMPQLRVETLSDLNYALVERFESVGGHITLIDATLDLAVPTVLACLRSKNEGAPSLVFAAAAHPDPEQAVRAVLEELALVERYGQEIRSSQLDRSVNGAASPIVDQIGHLGYWCEHEHASQADFLFRSSERVEFHSLISLDAGEPTATLKQLIDRLTAAGYRALVANLTTPDLRNLGLYVLRAVIPGLQPLFTGQHSQALGGDRLRKVPGLLGIQGAEIDPKAGFLPHPFLNRGLAS